MMVLSLCIVLAIVFTVAFNILSRLSLATTRHESAYTVLWQVLCALLAPLFLPLDRFSIALNPQVLLLFALLYSFFLGAALGVNSEVVKSFSIAPYMVAAFLFPAAANLLVFLRPKVVELRYELRVQWKGILLNAVVMDLSFFFLLRAFQLGNVPQVVAFSASSTLLTALVGIVILKENKHRALKIAAAGLATLGIVLLQL